MVIETTEESFVWATAYAKAESLSGWDDNIKTENIAAYADFAVLEFRRKGESTMMQEEITEEYIMLTTRTGVFWPTVPRVEDVNLMDIAHSLSMQCRFNGHCLDFYSVAQHSVHVADMVSPENKAWALLHDAAEAYIGDMVHPLKHSDGARWFRDIEKNIMLVICKRFNLPVECPAQVLEADKTMLEIEFENLMQKANDSPIVSGITAWDHKTARRRFMSFARKEGLR